MNEDADDSGAVTRAVLGGYGSHGCNNTGLRDINFGEGKMQHTRLVCGRLLFEPSSVRGARVDVQGRRRLLSQDSFALPVPYEAGTMTGRVAVSHQRLNFVTSHLSPLTTAAQHGIGIYNDTAAPIRLIRSRGVQLHRARWLGLAVLRNS